MRTPKKRGDRLTGTETRKDRPAKLAYWVGKVLRTHRVARGLHQRTVAKSMGVSTASVCGIENGRGAGNLEALGRASITVGLEGAGALLGMAERQWRAHIAPIKWTSPSEDPLVLTTEYAGISAFVYPRFPTPGSPFEYTVYDGPSILFHTLITEGTQDTREGARAHAEECIRARLRDDRSKRRNFRIKQTTVFSAIVFDSLLIPQGYIKIQGNRYEEREGAWMHPTEFKLVTIQEGCQFEEGASSLGGFVTLLKGVAFLAEDGERLRVKAEVATVYLRDLLEAVNLGGQPVFTLDGPVRTRDREKKRYLLLLSGTSPFKPSETGPRVRLKPWGRALTGTRPARGSRSCGLKWKS